jgi:hypothetical protein
MPHLHFKDHQLAIERIIPVDRTREWIQCWHYGDGIKHETLKKSTCGASCPRSKETASRSHPRYRRYPDRCGLRLPDIPKADSPRVSRDCHGVARRCVTVHLITEGRLGSFEKCRAWPLRETNNHAGVIGLHAHSDARVWLEAISENLHSQREAAGARRPLLLSNCRW